MTINPEQTDELGGMFKTWRGDYWMPLKTNREFAAHFSKPNAGGRLVHEIRMAFRRILRLENPVKIAVTTVPMPSATPADEAWLSRHFVGSAALDLGRCGSSEAVTLPRRLHPR